MELSNLTIIIPLAILGAWLVAWSGAFASDPLNCPPILRSSTVSGLLMLLGSFGPAILSAFLVAWWTAPIVWIITATLSNPIRMYIRKRHHIL